MNNLIKDIKTKLNIQGGGFIDAEIESYLEDIDPSSYLEFFKALSGDDYAYKNAMDRISIVASNFKRARSDSLFKGTQTRAKETYDRFYSVNCSMTTYSQEHRDKVPNDRKFFEEMDYKSLLDKNKQKVFNESDIYILKQLGGGEWLMNIKFIINSKDAVEKIENIIKSGITKKYLTPSNESIAHNVRKLLR